MANSINNEGQIVGLGLHNGVQSGYLLTPIPVLETSTLALFGMALLGLGIGVYAHRSHRGNKTL